MPEFRSISDLLAVFPNEQTIINYLEKHRWNGNVISPYDPTSKVYFCPSNNQYRCKNTKKFFNVKTGTIFARSKLSLQKWFLAFYLFSSHKKGISSCQLRKYLGITQKSAWYLLDDLRDSLKQSSFIKKMLEGFVEIDETYVGGKNKNRHWDKKVPKCQGRSWADKTPLLVMVERGGNAITKTVPNVRQDTLEPLVRENIKEGSNVYTDEWFAYKDLNKWFNHKIVNHRKKEYVNGKASVNSAENFNSHLKRGIQGTYHWISKKHVQKYADEFTFRFNTRKCGEQERFDLVLASVVGKRLTYQQLINP